MNFYNNKVRNVINHVYTKGLSLGKCLEITLMQMGLFQMIIIL